MKYSFTDIASEEFELLELCSSHYRTCWQESYAGRLSKNAMNELLEQSGPGELESWLIGHGNCRRQAPEPQIGARHRVWWNVLDSSLVGSGNLEVAPWKRSIIENDQVSICTSRQTVGPTVGKRLPINLN